MATDDEKIEAMARAAWDLHANVKWDDFFGRNPEKKQFYLDCQRTALAKLRELEAS